MAANGRASAIGAVDDAAARVSLFSIAKKIRAIQTATDVTFLAAIKAALDPRYVPVAGGVVLTDAAQTITTATVTDIAWGTEVSDPDSWTSGGSATLTVPAGKAGRYLVTFSGTWSANPTATAFASVNGVGFQSAPADAAAFIHTLTFLTTLSAGDALKFRVLQSSGSNKDVVSRLEIAPV